MKFLDSKNICVVGGVDDTAIDTMDMFVGENADFATKDGATPIVVSALGRERRVYVIGGEEEVFLCDEPFTEEDIQAWREAEEEFWAQSHRAVAEALAKKEKEA
jgi:hypothetical protein